MAGLPTVEHRNQDATCYVGNLDPACDEDLLLELFNHVGRVNSVHMPKDKLTNQHNGYGFVEYRDVTDADYAIQVMNMVKLHGRLMRVSKSSLDKKTGLNALDVGANLFLGNLDPDVDEKVLYDTFSAFGTIIRQPKVMRDEETNQSKGFGFVSFDAFESSDMAIECMHNQFLCNRQIIVQYAFKKSSNTEETGTAPGTRPERHGSRAERMLAASNPMRKYIANNIQNSGMAAAAAAAAAAHQHPPPPPGNKPNPLFAHPGAIPPPPPPPLPVGNPPPMPTGIPLPPPPPPPLPPAAAPTAATDATDTDATTLHSVTTATTIPQPPPPPPPMPYTIPVMGNPPPLPPPPPPPPDTIVPVPPPPPSGMPQQPQAVPPPLPPPPPPPLPPGQQQQQQQQQQNYPTSKKEAVEAAARAAAIQAASVTGGKLLGVPPPPPPPPPY